MRLATILKASEFMIRAHNNVKRKVTGEPYAVHPTSVARLVTDAGYGEPIIVAALLHDVTEDTRVKASEILTHFGSEVCQLVMEVSKVSREIDGDRATRIAMDNEHYAKGSAGGQSIKYADIIDNGRTILLIGNAFAKIWFAEKRSLLGMMTRGHTGLYYEARRIVDEFFASEVLKGHEQVR